MGVIVCVIVYMVTTLQAMQEWASSVMPQEVLVALKELQDNDDKIKHLMKAEIRMERKNSVPDFFGLFCSECLLPEGLKCCEDPLLRQTYLDSIEDKIIRKAIALNWVGKQFKEKQVTLLGTTLFVQRYQLGPGTRLIEGNDVRTAFVRDKLA